MGGLAIGLAASHYLNKHLQPYMLDLALNITGLTTDDLFYYKNKPESTKLPSASAKLPGG